LSYVQPMLLLVSLNRRFETASAALLVVLRSKTKEQLAQLLSYAQKGKQAAHTASAALLVKILQGL